MKSLKFRLQYAVLLLLILFARFSAFAQITPSQDAYINTASAATNFGSAATLGVVSTASSIQTTYIQFDLSSIPSTYKSSNVAKATLKLFVNSVSSSGSFNLDLVNGSWSEKTITADLLPALGTTIKGSVPLTTGSVNNYIMLDLTTVVGEWLNGTQANDGIALVPNSGLSATFQSKENTNQSHPAELDIVFTSGGNGTITGVMAGTGLEGGGTSGTVGLSLQKTCSTSQVLQWNGTAWVCATVGTGTISGVTAGTGLTGGGASGAVTLNLDTSKVPQLVGNNAFTGGNTFTGNASTAILAFTNGNTPAIWGDALATGTGTTIGVAGTSSTTSGYGVLGNGGSSGTGVYGISSIGPGVSGASAGGSAAGVSGVNSASGYGVLGLATGSSGQGVWGESFATSWSNGAGPDGVHGITHSNQGTGVSGTNTDQNGIGVWGSDPKGYGFVTDSNVSQARNMGGWAKAMAYVDFTGKIYRCFNSQFAGSAASTVPCGITVTTSLGTDGAYRDIVDFGFEVDDRFVMLTFGYSDQGNEGYYVASDWWAFSPKLSPSQVLVYDNTSRVPSAASYFYVIVF